MYENLGVNNFLYRETSQDITQEKSAEEIKAMNEVASENLITGSFVGGFDVVDGFIKGGQTAYNTGTGFFIGLDSGTYKLSLGVAGGSGITWDGTTMTITGTITATSGTIGGWSIGATSLTSGTTNIILDSSNKAISINNATFGNSGIQLQYNSGTPRAYIGDGVNAYFQYDGVKIQWKAANTTLDASGNLSASSATISGTITATAGAIGGWSIVDGYIYNLVSGTPTSLPSDGIVMASGNESIIIYENTEKRVELGYLSSGVYGIKGYADNGTTVLFELSDTQKLISGIPITNIATGTEIAIQGWQATMIFSATDYRTVAWGSGTITLLDGTTYSITGANTGNISALTYIYLDIAVSTTLLQTTTTAANAVGSGKILIAVAKNNSDTTSKAEFQVFGGSGGKQVLVDNISANSASTNEFISNTAQIKNLIVTDAKINDLAVSKLTAGSITSKAITLAVAAGTGDAKIQAGKTDFTNTENGFILGIDDSDSDKAKFYIGDTTTYLNWDGTNLAVKAGTGSSIDFSYVSGATKPEDNATDGATFGDNISGGGSANRQIGNDGYTTLYRQDKFCDGSDGDVTISSNTTLTSDMYYNDLTVNNGYTLNTGGYRVFVQGTLTNNGTIARNGNNGGNGGNGGTYPNAGTGGAALADGFLVGGEDGKAGGNGGYGSTYNNNSNTAGAVGTNGDSVASLAMGVSGKAGVAGGKGGDSFYSGSAGGAGGSAGTATAPTNKIRSITELIVFRDYTSASPTKLNGSAGSGGSGGGGGGESWTLEFGGDGGGGGGSGSSGGIILICASTIINTGTISCLGGNGGNGGNGENGSGGGGAGGGGGGAGSGGSGGVLVLIYQSLTDSGTISVAGGSAGSVGSGGTGTGGATNGENGSAGNAGNTGTLIQLEC